MKNFHCTCMDEVKISIFVPDNISEQNPAVFTIYCSLDQMKKFLENYFSLAEEKYISDESSKVVGGLQDFHKKIEHQNLKDAHHHFKVYPFNDNIFENLVKKLAEIEDPGLIEKNEVEFILQAYKNTVDIELNVDLISPENKSPHPMAPPPVTKSENIFKTLTPWKEKYLKNKKSSPQKSEKTSDDSEQKGLNPK